MQKGKVKFYNRSKNYGFITGDDGKDYFVHVSGIANGAHIKDGDRVSFNVTDGERGPKADNIELLK